MLEGETLELIIPKNTQFDNYCMRRKVVLLLVVEELERADEMSDR